MGETYAEVQRRWYASNAEIARLERRIHKLEARIAVALGLVEFYRATHGCEPQDICTGCAAATALLAKNTHPPTP